MKQLPTFILFQEFSLVPNFLLTAGKLGRTCGKYLAIYIYKFSPVDNSIKKAFAHLWFCLDAGMQVRN